MASNAMFAPQYEQWAQDVLKSLTSQGYQAKLTGDPNTAPYLNPTSPNKPLSLYNVQLGDYVSNLSPTMGVSPEDMAKQIVTNQKWSSAPGEHL